MTSRGRGPRFARRRIQRLGSERGALDRLEDALRTLRRASEREDPMLLALALELLVRHLDALCAYLVTVDGTALETRWWWPDQGEAQGPPPVPSWCRWILQHPHRNLALKTLPEDLEVALPGLEVQAALGMALWQGDQAKALVFVLFGGARQPSRGDLALLDAVAGFMGRVMEVEELKGSIARLEDALAITRAVMEDSSIEDPATDLPNLRYLDVWLRAKISPGVPARAEMTVAGFTLPQDEPENRGRIKSLAGRIRGGDLLVSEGQGRFLVLLRRTNKALGNIFLRRLAELLGEVPLGATLWVPGKDDSALDSVRRRLDSALEASRGRPGHGLVWELPEPALDPAPEGKEAPGPETEDLGYGEEGIRPWRPRTIGQLPAKSETPSQEAPMKLVEWPRFKGPTGR